ncbi:histidine phosphatase family protein [uncultured Cocleimonas sp.]|uniref:histidine phosphatase family protein n=1 Tax=uncultured Cocleimonas sp. TaxID=1051587 RepID=UPI002605F6A4|nr:histidine phosphatase family protein [uncultured Cocleimonas sp.]
MTEQTTTIIDILRHGEPEGGSMYRGGGTDHHLSDVGWKQMHRSVERNTADWSSIITSPMLRCSEFAQQLADSKDIPIEEVENFREAGYGKWEGRTATEIMRESEKEYWNFFDDPVKHRPENAELLEFFTPRVNDAFGKLLSDHQGQHVLLVTHLGVTRAILGIILGMPLASQQLIDMPFAGMVRIINDRKGLRLLLR